MIYNDSSFSNSDSEMGSQNGKMFVGGLHLATTTEALRAYFSQFGEIIECVIMRDTKTNCSRGFGFVTYANANNLDKVFAIHDHYLDGKKVDPQPAIRSISPARSVHNVHKKLFVGGISQMTSVEDLKNYFANNFGEVEDVILKINYSKQTHRGFGFITFCNPNVAKVVADIRFHYINGKQVEAKQAQKKEDVKPKNSYNKRLPDSDKIAFQHAAAFLNLMIAKLASSASLASAQSPAYPSAVNLSSSSAATPPAVKNLSSFVCNESSYRKRLAAKYIRMDPVQPAKLYNY